MSVMIKGMEMPKEGCKDCPLVKRKRVFDICPFLKREVDGNVERGGKPLDCPLVEVKTPHGRLIDADKLIVLQLHDENDNPVSPEFVPAEFIDEAETIIEAEGG